MKLGVQFIFYKLSKNFPQYSSTETVNQNLGIVPVAGFIPGEYDAVKSAFAVNIFK